MQKFKHFLRSLLLNKLSGNSIQRTLQCLERKVSSVIPCFGIIVVRPLTRQTRFLVYNFGIQRLIGKYGRPCEKVVLKTISVRGYRFYTGTGRTLRPCCVVPDIGASFLSDRANDSLDISCIVHADKRRLGRVSKNSIRECTVILILSFDSLLHIQIHGSIYLIATVIELVTCLVLLNSIKLLKIGYYIIDNHIHKPVLNTVAVFFGFVLGIRIAEYYFLLTGSLVLSLRNTSVFVHKPQNGLLTFQIPFKT